MAIIYAPGSTVFNNGPVIYPSVPQPAPQPAPTVGITFTPLGCLLLTGLFGKVPRKCYLKSVNMANSTIEVTEESGVNTTIDTKTNRIYINAPYSVINNYENNFYQNPYINAPGSQFSIWGRKIDLSQPIIAITNQVS
ncbi:MULTISPECIES: hypothetical protein [Pseudomonas]|uniref:hypothetical protein n=1 Tax=Pseudomonas TaxID=286 RepID=UPI001374EF5E|nr:MULTISPECIES: hypothetical protein [Pseudomonas]UOP12660.1 hypothetical protein LDL65_08995 [Pseudomonas palleroniana]